MTAITLKLDLDAEEATARLRDMLDRMDRRA